jgi:hypothetical protein
MRKWYRESEKDAWDAQCALSQTAHTCVQVERENKQLRQTVEKLRWRLRWEAPAEPDEFRPIAQGGYGWYWYLAREGEALGKLEKTS